LDREQSDGIIKVTCAIIEKNNRILAAQRGKNMGMAFKWEFPGGKIEPGEAAKECIIREIKEELDADIDVVDELPSHIHRYANRTIELIPFVCRLNGERLYAKEHNTILWDDPRNMSSLDWAEADIPVHREYLRYLSEKG
jgi:8-oxo-dGTP diphosphatase